MMSVSAILLKPGARRGFVRGLRLAVLAGLGLGSMAAHAAPTDGGLVYIGTMAGNKPGQGIFSVRLNPRTGRLDDLELAAQLFMPSWLAVDPQRPVLYAVNETGDDGKTPGHIYSFAIDPPTGQLTVIDKVASGGEGPAYLGFDQRLNTLFVAHFGGGEVGAIPVEADGRLDPPSSVQTAQGSSAGPGQAGVRARAHEAVVDPGGHFVLVPDLGLDRVFVYRFDPGAKTLSPADPPFLVLPPGSGPRHLVFSRDGRFVFLDTELSAQIASLGWDAQTGRLTLNQIQSADKPGFDGQKSVAEIARSKDGRFVYVSNRGEDSVVVFAANPKTGTLTSVQDIDCGGRTPRSFGIDPSGRWMVVANQASNSLTVFKIDRKSGKLSPTGQVVSVFAPAAVAFYPG